MDRICPTPGAILKSKTMRPFAPQNPPSAGAEPPSAPSPEPRHPQPCAAPPILHRRNGKIARLPLPAREALNLMLRDGATYGAIIRKLAEQGHALNHDNLSRWHAGGYQDWLNEQSCLEEMRFKMDFASQVIGQRNADRLTEASLRIAASRMYNLLLNFDPAVLKPALATSPGLYPRLLNSLCKLTDGALKHQRCRAQQLVRLPTPATTPVRSDSR